MANTKFKKGHKKIGGRKKGIKNKITHNIKEMVMNALNDKRVGGEEEFVKWIIANKRNKELFYTWLMKMIPSNVDIDHSGKIDGKLIIEVIKTE